MEDGNGFKLEACALNLLLRGIDLFEADPQRELSWLFPPCGNRTLSLGERMPRDYRLHEINDREFERLVVQICVHWLGEGVQPFADGKDGGRDGKFYGVANSFPSDADRASGHFVLQAKHTSLPNKSCSDSDFPRLLKKEHIKVKRLSAAGICDHYLVFTNRRLTGGTDEKLTEPLVKLGPKTAYIVAVDRIHMAIDRFKDVWESLPNLHDTLPFRFDPEDLREVIGALHGYVEEGADSAFDSAHDFEKIGIAEKNRINRVTPAYYKEIMGPDTIQFSRIEAFLKNPRNGNLADLYHDSANELKAKILVHRDRFEAFDNVFLFLAEEIQRGSDVLRGKRRMIRTLLHYMYSTCDIGSKHDVSHHHAHA